MDRLIFSIDDSEDNRVVPVLEMRAGVEYAYQLENGMFVGAKIGYEWQNGFNMMVVRRKMDDVDEQLMYTDTTDLSLDGFFVEGFLNF
jgi:Legionella pneumophila major outer membrane protein precursor